MVIDVNSKEKPQIPEVKDEDLGDLLEEGMEEIEIPPELSEAEQ